MGNKKVNVHTIEDLVSKLKQVKNFLDSLFSILPEQIYCMDKEGNIIFCNDQQAKAFGLASSKELIGKNIYDVAVLLGWDKSIPARINQNDKMVMKSRLPLITEEEIVLNKEKKYFLINKSPLLNKENEVIGIIGISIDITDRKKAEELRIKNEVAEKVIKFINLMAGSMAHELKMPLAAIELYVDLIHGAFNLKRPPKELEEDFKKSYVAIKKVIKSETYVISDMLLKLRSFAIGGAPKVDLARLSMVSSLEKFLATFPFEKGEEKLLKIIYNDRFFYFGDEMLTEHVLANLMKNAREAIKEKGEGDITIELKAGKKDNQLIFRDTAIGIPKDFLPKIFDQFETKKTAKGGTGLGLAFCKMVMEYYGGTIKCNSKEGKYTEFVMSFPKVE